ncbi:MULTISPECIES: carbohydrate ABC transporter permease [Streptomyces]|uniref:Alpha-1,4-digalacturonate transport system permease protein n=1 Tax=Streptomyces stelliscabiei TaxID=146820 RepID=A0A8I0PH35_9ACTN|nr:MULTISPECIES: sugar ABC transporter permease [Streptomyces]KND42574.1 sugar ABC transporter permease [Streptomyces stelliscabiei]MBE1602175.1 alpha-1,4-digalacturonate transport system permease protein [Streptomyces stelliscabiei]MDX2514384.1 sugar ABC transporter permease [Streptomyces stelliscabiei]MDX2552351.1 sugar ABC transporter permease [Streptomyces stelliscabiei]MDX2611746.1 sugar ABC transporter permease [Streptomyces stelliscabiei]
MTKHASAVSASPPRRRSKYTLAPLVLIAANVVLFSLFFVWPAVIGLIYSFTNYTGVGAFQYIGLDNYHNLFGDSTFYAALTRTLLYAVLFVPLNFAVSLLTANLLVSKHAKGASVARVIFFIPWLLSPIVVGVLWRWLFGENFGLVNYIIEQFGGSAVPWQSNADLSLIVVVMAASWAWTGFSMLLFIAAIKNVPVSYYEAASLDGAGPWRQFFSITLPSIAPTSFIVILLNTINAMKEYPVFVALNNGGPGTSNNLLVQYIYETGFKRGQIGYASAASFVLMLILMAVAIVQLIVNRRVENR